MEQIQSFVIKSECEKEEYENNENDHQIKIISQQAITTAATFALRAQEYENKENDHQRKTISQQATTTAAENLTMTSMSALISWNISKAVEKNPVINLKTALRDAQEWLDKSPRNIKETISQFPEHRYISCALFAWKKLGHAHADSLYEFFANSQKQQPDSVVVVSKPSCHIISDAKYKRNNRYEHVVNRCEQVVNRCEIEPGVKIPTLANPQTEACESMCSSEPINTKPIDLNPLYESMKKTLVPLQTTVMHMDSHRQNAHQPLKRKTMNKDLMRKIDEACCLESGCVERLASLDKSIKELQSRAKQLARREADRAELLERAATAWKELERGYQRRLTRAVETEDDITRQMAKSINERNGFKNVCSSLAKQLEARGGEVQGLRDKLSEVEKEVCQLACQRLQLSEEVARGDAALAHQQALATQLDRDLQFKEEQARRKLACLRSELESAMGLMNEIERAMRAELSGLREQISQVSADLLQEDDRTALIKEELSKLETLKHEMSEDLEGCRDTCDRKMQVTVDELVGKRQLLENLMEQSLECRCKLPKNSYVEVKRTASLAALCKCSPEDKFLESCSCTSLRTNLLSHLLSDLFEGLQSELPETELAMPCQMLKCLEDKHNWDKSNVKAHLRQFFSKLLVGELEIAIATSIEKHHARWVGASCADRVKRSIPDFEPSVSDNWQQKALERRAQQIGKQLAEQMFKEKADIIMEDAKKVVETGPPPCACDTKIQQVSSEKKDKIDLLTCSCDNPFSYPSSAQSAKSDKSAKSVMSAKPHRCTDTRDLPCCSDRTSAYFPCLVDVVKSKNKGFNQQTLNSSEEQDVTVTKKSGCSTKTSVTGNKNRPAVNHHHHDDVSLEITASRDIDNDTPDYLRQTINEVTLLRAQMNTLKEEAIKKNDLLSMEYNITKLIHQSTADDQESQPRNDIAPPPPSESSKKSPKKCRLYPKPNTRVLCAPPVITVPKQGRITKKKQIDTSIKSVSMSTVKQKKPSFKRPGQSFAVNLCLCGETKAPKNVLEQAKSMSQKLKQSYVENPSKADIQTKPSEVDKCPEQQSCKTGSACLKNIPSNCSIDTLLETLTKWNSTLNDSFDKCKEKTNKQSDKILCPGTLDENKSRCIRKMISESKSKSKIGSFDEVNIINKNQDESNFISSKEVESPVVNQEVKHNNHPLCATTESEYMGAVNLEKSYEMFCRCAIAKEVKKSKGWSPNIINDSNYPITCLDSCNCCKKYLENICDAHSSPINAYHIKQNTFSCMKAQTKNLPILISDSEKSVINPNKNKSVVTPTSNIGHREHIATHNENERNDKHAFDHIVHNEKLFPSDRDYRVKFLGVTLTNDIRKSSEEPFQDKNQDYQNIYSGHSASPPPLSPIAATTNETTKTAATTKETTKNHQSNTFSYSGHYYSAPPLSRPCVTLKNTRNPVTPVYNSSQSNKISSGRYGHELPLSNTGFKNVNDQQEFWSEKYFAGYHNRRTGFKHSSLAINTKLPSYQCHVNLGDLRDLVCKKKIGSFITKDDKEVDANTLKTIGYESCNEPCVCCYNKNTQESQEIEDNTFLLLEEHLKQKFNLLKDECYSCFSNDEKGKFCSTTLGKIKEIIAHCADSISCHCDKNQEIKGTWKRANDLLQEYLKLKLDRVLCACASSSHIGVENKSIVPDVTDKVYNLIQNDFKRLKNLCRCNKLKVSSNEKQKKSNNLTNPTPSANKIEIESKSCHAIRKQLTDAFIQTSENKIGMKKDSSNHNENMANIIECLTKVQDNESNDLIPCKIEKYGDKIVQTVENPIETKDQCSNSIDNLITTSLECLMKIQKNESIDLIPSKIKKNGSETDKIDPKVMHSYEKSTYEYDKKTVTFEPLLPFIGHTLECSCGKTSSNCICPKSTVKKTLINDIWNSFTNRKVNNNMSYIMDNVRKSDDSALCSTHEINNINKDAQFCDFESSANCGEIILLKEFDHNLNPEDQTTNTYFEDVLSMGQKSNLSLIDDDHNIRYKGISISDSEHHGGNFGTVNSNHNDIRSTRTRSETIMTTTNIFKDENNGCECDTVPVCHVKMLIQDIEHKLVNRECVCDSMRSRVCPLHSRQNQQDLFSN